MALLYLMENIPKVSLYNLVEMSKPSGRWVFISVLQYDGVK